MDVARSVLGRAVGTVLQAEHDQGRIRGKHVEKGERRGIDHTLRAQRGDEGNRTGHDQAAEELIALAGLELGKVEGQVRHQASGGNTTPVCDVINP
jgi:hypothetical protein